MAQSLRHTKHVEASISETWASLKAAWRNYKAARMNSNQDKMIECAKQIKELQKSLGAKESEFPELNI